MSDREMSEQDTQFLLGRLIGETAKRDAIHIAVAPGVAAEPLAPGEHIGIVGEHFGRCVNPIGIVDPYLTGRVFKGDRFWMFLYPNTITSLRHQWTHSAFDATISKDSHIIKSQEWIDSHAKLLGLTADAMMENAENWIRYEDYTVQQGSEHWRDNFNPKEFWHHYEIVTGKTVGERLKQSFYCCTC